MKRCSDRLTNFVLDMVCGERFDWVCVFAVGVLCGWLLGLIQTLAR